MSDNENAYCGRIRVCSTVRPGPVLFYITFVHTVLSSLHMLERGEVTTISQIPAKSML